MRKIKWYNSDKSYESWICRWKQFGNSPNHCKYGGWWRVYALLGPFESPRRQVNFSGTMILCFMKVSASNQTLLPRDAWQCSRIFDWSATGILSHFPMCSKSQAWFGFEHFLSWNEKKEHNFLLRSLGNNSAIGVPSLQRNRPALVKSLVAGLTFCFFPTRSRAGVPGGEASGLTFRAAISHSWC